MSFPQGPTRVGMDTAGDMSGAAWNADGSAKIEWATVLQNISTTLSGGGSEVTITTTTPLSTGGVYTSSIIDRLSLQPVPTYAFAFSQSDVASAATGFIIQQGDSPTLSDASTIVSATASAGALTTLAPTALTKRYFSFQYTNAHANAQTTFTLVGGYTTGGDEVSGGVTDTVLTQVEDQITHYLGVKDVILNAVEDQRVHYLATAPLVTTATLQSAATGTGVGTAYTITGQKMVAIQVTSTVVGAITYDFEVSVDGTNFMTGIDAVDMLGADNLGSITQTGAGTWIYQIMCAGIAKIQCNITANAATGGTSVTVTAQAVA